ncbi:DUF1624 domain-containing protein [Nesterenkonia salmonea]|uniref:DUF1624 domain-containing protein n=1 Tax=Nesterenkonia salmonea TaxID=1804987 RepID=A0A5R9BA18_9MICC|nr:heparan-alpha-glucosaminide N-acetyltransferase domain-containing protein [Nesterenkonia salmonea]TLP96367.1 DUF1624 domain-containing protein [Nesterenkonia salmonea]
MSQLEKPSTNGHSSSRITALDATRALAIFGMVIVNVGVADSTGLPALIVSVLHGRAAILFIVLAGMGVTILTRSLRSTSAPVWPSLLWRAAVLMVIGLALQQLPTGVNVILMLYAALFVIALIAVRLPSRWLLGFAAGMTLVGPVAYIALHSTAGLPAGPASLARGPLDSAAAIYLTGPYPLIVWIAPFLFGMFLGRLDLRSRSVQHMLIIAGAACAAVMTAASWGLIQLFGEPDAEQVGPDHLLLASGHSQMPLWVLSAVGTSALMIGTMLILTPRIGRLAYPLVVTGQFALTAYCLHLAAIAVLVRPASENPNRGLLVSAIIIGLIIALCALWRAFATRGPLETLLRLPNFLTR